MKWLRSLSNPTKISFILILLAGSLSSCNFFLSGGDQDEGDKGEPVARVYDRYLYEEDVQGLVQESVSRADSMSILQNYINLWAKEQLLLYKAEYNLTEEQKNFEEQIRNYRNDLLKFTYQQKYIRQNLDTNISAANIKAYYRDHSENFQLKENILKTRYIILSSEAPTIDNARKWFRSSEEDDRNRLRDYVLKYATEFSLDDTSWVSFDRVAAKIPLETYNQIDFLTNNKFVETSVNDQVYLLEVVDYKIKDGISPLTYVEDIIQNILLNQRKLELLSDLERNLLDDALKKKEFETF